MTPEHHEPVQTTEDRTPPGAAPAWISRRRLLTATVALTGAVTLGMPMTGSGSVARANQPAGDFAGLVSIGERSLWLDARGNGDPVVILESGFGNNAQIWDTIALEAGSAETAVHPAVASMTRVCAYDRPGTIVDADHRSRSDPTAMPRTAADVVTDLHALLYAAGVPAPYILVGHSFGGVVVRLFAATYPDEVVGMVLVDAADEGLHDRLRAAMTAEHWAAYERISKEVSPDLADYADLERVDLDASFGQLRAATALNPLPELPLVVLSRGLSQLDAELVPEDVGLPSDFPIDAIEPAWQEGQDNLAELIPNVRRVLATKSGHYIQLDEPGLVIDAVEQVIEAVRDPSSWSS